MVTKAVILIITVANTWTGETLYTSRMSFGDRVSVSGNEMEDCRQYGVREARRLSEKYGPHASTNVNCHWEERVGQPS